ncbi:2OG-Fe(II) oxygenase [Sphingopyxis sp.]|uniref:2OG-Fe(II) oxygenase n=1 Tax=Sphingopyxis sp. TaxID=1908224 RepID=UPI003BA9F19D
MAQQSTRVGRSVAGRASTSSALAIAAANRAGPIRAKTSAPARPSAPAAPILKPIVGSPAPWFKAPVLDGNPEYTFHTVAGRVTLLFFVGSAESEAVRGKLAELLAHDLFDDRACSLFIVTHDPEDARSGRIQNRLPGVRVVLDYDRAISDAYGASRLGGDGYDPYVMVLDRQLRVAGRYLLPRADESLILAERLIGEAGVEDWAPVLSVPRVLDQAMCRQLMDLYDADGGSDSGFMREVDGKTVQLIDYGHKRRSDFTIDDSELCRSLRARIGHCVRPAIQRAFNFDATRMERYIVACYEAELGGHFRPHRDNTTKGTAHRRFAVTINLNEDFDGGELRFPEFGSRTYRAPPGGAIVFGCGLLHEATPVTRGRRYAFLPFLYDDAAAAEREANNKYLGEGVGDYTRG